MSIDRLEVSIDWRRNDVGLETEPGVKGNMPKGAILELLSTGEGNCTPSTYESDELHTGILSVAFGVID